MSEFKSLPKANARIAELIAVIAEKDSRIADLKTYVDDLTKGRAELDRRMVQQARDLQQARDETRAAIESQHQAEMTFARAAGYIAATKGEPFAEPQQALGWQP